MEAEPELLPARDRVASQVRFARLVLRAAWNRDRDGTRVKEEELMHLAGVGQTVYGPQLPCCPNAAAATAGALKSGVPCDPNCLEGDTQAAGVERMQAAIDALTAKAYLDPEQQQPTPSASWFPGVSNMAVIAVGVGLGAILLLGRRR
jgi:hypothetical protein